MSEYDHLGGAELEALKQDLRAKRRELEPQVLPFTKRRQAGTGGTMQRVVKFDTLTSRQSDVWNEYVRLGDEAMKIQRIQGARKQERTELYQAVNGKFNYHREFVCLARKKLTPAQIEEIEDLLDRMQDDLDEA